MTEADPTMPEHSHPDRAALDRLALDAAIAQAEKSRDEGGIPIGAALVTPDGVVVAAGHNMRVQAGDPTAHGEMSCIRAAGRRRDWHTLTMATTLSPCAMCAGAVVLHRIPRVVIGESRTFQGREDWLRDAGIEVVVVDDAGCVAMMERFIAEHPELWKEDIGVPGQ
ncbi:MAG: nucleoside deaminase [Planctomycetota bacterium]|nr:nucleoside deaminase [Planctomycetota bacterium]